MKTYKEHENQTKGMWTFGTGVRGSGVACPDCGNELVGSPTLICTSYPPRVLTACASGHYHYLTIPVEWRDPPQEVKT